MPTRGRLLLASLFCSVAFFSVASSQEASPYVPLAWWGSPFIEHLITAGRIVDPSPLTRPFRAEELLRALDAVDSNITSGPEWAVVQRVKADLVRHQRGPSARIDMHAGVQAAAFANRDPLRERGTGHGNFSGGAALTLFFGPAVIVSHPYFDTRLKWDPEYFGKKDRIIGGRAAEADLNAQWGFGEVFFGSLHRHWGPRFPHRLLVSPRPHKHHHFPLSVRPDRRRVHGVHHQHD